MQTRPNTPPAAENLPLISCIMPTYGRPRLVNEAVTMFLDQDYPNKELVILNDCMQQFFFSTLPGVRVHNHASRFPTLGQKRNTCIQLSQGEFIAVWDDDDVYLPWRLPYSLEKLRRFNTPFYRPAEFLAYWGEQNLHDNFSIPGWIAHSTVLFRKDLWHAVGGYPALDVGEDAAFFAAIHDHLGQAFIRHPIERHDRFMILRGKSPYRHMSIQGGAAELDTSPGIHLLQRTQIADPLLRRHLRRHTKDRIRKKQPPAPGYPTHLPPPDSFAVTEVATAAWDNEPVLSVCVSLLDRSRVEYEGCTLELFPNCVRSLETASRVVGPLELVVADFGSTDWPLHQWLLHQASPTLRIKVVTLNEPFSRGRGLNVAARHALSNWLFLCDSDMLIQPDALRRGLKALRQGMVSFPICRYLDRDGRPEFWQDAGMGLAFLHRHVLEQAGGVPEFQSWGGEDDLLRDRVLRSHQEVRQRDHGLLHQWHPEEIRHTRYARPCRSDFENHLRPAPATVAHTFLARHPLWAGGDGTIQLLDNGRMHRVGVEGGRYEFEPRVRIVLHWDHWPPETLFWNEHTGCYEDPTKPFTLHPQNPPDQSLPASRPLQQIREQFSELAEHLRNLGPFQFFSPPGNWGDAIIRSGTLAFFRHLDLDFFEIPSPDAATPDLPAVMGGGGGFCRFWHLSPRLLRSLTDRCQCVVVLPSTYELHAIPPLHAVRNVHFYARELLSVQGADHFSMRFCPDMAFWNPVPPCPPPSKPQLNAFRVDGESLGFHKKASPNRDISAEHDRSGDWQRFFWELARYEHVRTDRTHVAIASAMLGRKVTFYPNAYHKNQGIYECSLRHFNVAWRTQLEEE